MANIMQVEPNKNCEYVLSVDVNSPALAIRMRICKYAEQESGLFIPQLRIFVYV